MSVVGAQFSSWQFNKTTGAPYSGVLLYHYEPGGTTTDRTAWTDEAKTTPAAQPIVGDTKGRVSGYFEGNYRIKIVSSASDGSVVLYDWDPIKFDAKAATLRSENQGAAYPAATSANLGQMFAKTSGSTVTEVGINTGSSFDALQFQGASLTTTQQWAKGADIASASTLTLGSDGNFFDVTGTTGISAISTKAAGTVIGLRFISGLTLTHNSTSLILLDRSDLRIGAGGVMYVMSLGSGNWLQIVGTREPIQGQCRLTYNSSTSLVLNRFGGNRVHINGITYRIPSAGVTLTNSGLSAATLYYIYLYDNSGTLTLEASTTAETADTNHGYPVKTGDATRLLVGMARTNASSQFADSATTRFVLSYYNRRSLGLINNFTTDRTTTSSSFAELNSEIRCEFITWADEAVQFSSAVGVGNSTISTNSYAVTFDGVTTDTSTNLIIGTNTTGAGTYLLPIFASVSKVLAVGYHYATAAAKTTAGTFTVNSAGYITGTIRG